MLPVQPIALQQQGCMIKALLLRDSGYQALGDCKLAKQARV